MFSDVEHLVNSGTNHLTWVHKQTDSKPLTCITRIFNPVSWANCSRMCLVGFGVALNEAFKTSNCFAFIVVLGPLLLLPAFPFSTPSLLLLLSLVSILEQLLPGLMFVIICESGERGLGHESDKWSRDSSFIFPGEPGEFVRSDFDIIGWWLLNNGFSFWLLERFWRSWDLVSKWSLSREKSLSDILSWFSNIFSKSPSSSISEAETKKEIYEPLHDKTNKMPCAPIEDSDQPGHPPSLIRVFAVRMKKNWVLSYILRAQRRLWSDWADAILLILSWSGTYFSTTAKGLWRRAFWYLMSGHCLEFISNQCALDVSIISRKSEVHPKLFRG